MSRITELISDKTQIILSVCDPDDEIADLIKNDGINTETVKNSKLINERILQLPERLIDKFLITMA